MDTYWQKTNGICNLNDLYFELILREEVLPSSILATVIFILDASMSYELVECYLPVITIRNIPSGLVKGKPSQEHSWGPVVIIVFVTVGRSDVICGTGKEPLVQWTLEAVPMFPTMSSALIIPQFLHIFNMQTSKDIHSCNELNNFAFSWICKFNFASCHEQSFDKHLPFHWYFLVPVT